MTPATATRRAQTGTDAQTGPDTEAEASTELDPRAVREAAGMTAAEMADLLDMSVFGYQSWEDGRRRPGGPARQMLKLIDQAPDTVRNLLARAA